jgi:hypothetical protein
MLSKTYLGRWKREEVKFCQSVCEGILAYPLKLDLHTDHKMLWYVKLGYKLKKLKC